MGAATDRTGGLRLTARQTECLRRIARGETTLEIAAALQLSPHTVDHYIGKACDRLRAKTRAHAVAKAIGLDLIDGSAGDEG